MNAESVSARANAALIEEYHQRWLENPESVDPTWRAFFQGFALGSSGQPAAGPSMIAAASGVAEDVLKQSGVYYLINAYRTIGHVQAHINPLEPNPPPPSPKLALPVFRLSEDDLDTVFDTGNYRGGGRMKLRDLLANLQITYCEHTGVEYTHIQNQDCRRWLQERIESSMLEPTFTKAQQIRILRRVHKAELFEKFLHTKYVGQKRFSLEGGETIIAALDAVIDHCPKVGVEEIVMGMAHRGRLNVLCNVMRKSFDLLFEQFSENYIPDTVAGDGDVKYHLGYESLLTTTSGAKVEVRLAANPSHLEIVNPVVEGKARARQRQRGDTAERRKVMPLLIHGDAAIAGQGIVAETLQFSQLPGYRTGGTLHFVINNQIGFTTDPVDSRSSRYCTDVAKMIEAPIFHVNGDDPEEVCMVAQLALEFRDRWRRDVFIDMYCYRKHGHNETDEPSFTQPLMYRKIAGHDRVSTHYTRQLIAEGSLTEAEGEAIQAEYSAALDEHLGKAKTREAAKAEKRKSAAADPFKGSDAVRQRAFNFTPVETKVTPAVVERVFNALTSVPDTFKLHPKIARFVEGRAKAGREGGPFDWGAGEALAFGSLLLEGTPVRLSGQDCQRGTFTHRHAVFNDHENGSQYVPLNQLGQDQARFCVYNSLLSEAAVLGFDYGYSLDYPDMLILWEAQFGDFANGAQVIIDQFLAAGESKWQRASSLVLLLPHGYEGQGPEHSSARLERFLTLCAEENMQVANLTTSAQYFHALRRQVKREFRKPLIIMAPKSLLRHAGAASPVADFTEGAFQEIIDDPLFGPKPAKAPDRLILCSGKVYYDLLEYREKHEAAGAALIRVEQLYPLHRDRLAAIAEQYPRDARLVWCQEEPENAGAWRWIAPQLEEIFGRRPVYAGRDAAASPAVGLLAIHRTQLARFLKQAFTL